MYISYNVNFKRMRNSATRYVVKRYIKEEGRLYLEKVGRTYASFEAALNKLSKYSDGYISRTGTMNTIAVRVKHKTHIIEA